MRFRDLLSDEYARRRAANRRYSLRAFARFLGVDHSTLSQLMRGRRRLMARAIARLGGRLGVGEGIIRACGASENDDAVLRAVGREGFRADSRWLAVHTGLPVDEVNVSLQRLLYGGALTMVSRTTWRREGEACRIQS